MAERRWLTPPQLAKEIGIDPEKVIAWINAGAYFLIALATSLPVWRQISQTESQIFQTKEA